MRIRHHLSEEILMEYAAGSLAEGWSIAVASHLALCPDCRRKVDMMEQAGGAMLGDIVCEDTSVGDSWGRMKARIASEDAVAKPLSSGGSAARPTAVIPEPLRSYLGGDVADLKWRSLGRGAYHIPVPVSDKETSVRLLRIPAGKPVPEHSHGGRELTLVLCGSFRDGEERFARGDIEEADESLQHQPVADKGEDCICLAVTDAPLKFKSWLLKMVQPVLGI